MGRADGVSLLEQYYGRYLRVMKVFNWDVVSKSRMSGQQTGEADHSLSVVRSLCSTAHS